MRKFDRFGFEILEDEEPIDFTSIDEDDSDIMESDGTMWYESESVLYDDEFEDEEEEEIA